MSAGELTNISYRRLSSTRNEVPISIEKTSITENVNISGLSKHRTAMFPYLLKLIFKDCTFLEDITIDNKSEAGEVEFLNCVFSKNVHINYGNVDFKDDCLFKGNLIINTSQKGDVKISKYFLGEGELELQGVAKKVTIKDVSASIIKFYGEVEELLFEDINSPKGLLKFSDSSRYHKKFEIKNSSFEAINFSDITLNTPVCIINCDIDKLITSKSSGDQRIIKIYNSRVSESKVDINVFQEVKITDSIFGLLEMYGINGKENSFVIEKTVFNNLKFTNVINNGLFTFREVSTNNIISFKSSNLGKTDFINCNFSKAKLDFENSKMTDLFLAETEFPRKVYKNGKLNYRQAQLAFGQIATACQKQGDNIRTLEYNSREVEAHYKTIKFFSGDFFQKINLSLNFISNNFGRDWMRGVFFSLCIGLLFFCLLLISTNNYEWGIPMIDTELISPYLKFMNPLRFFELESIFNNTSNEGNIILNGASFIADFLGRIFVAYGYYQTIQAFRRFGKK